MIERIIPFEPTHIDLMDIREIEVHTSFCLPDAKQRIVAMKEASIECGTFILGGRVIFCAGAMQLWPGVLEGWIIPSIYVPENPIWFVKKAKGYFDAFVETFKCHRFQTVSPVGEQHDKWMELLGFKKEGVMTQYTFNKQDYAMYARVL